MEILEFQLGIPSVNLETMSLSPKLAKYIPVRLRVKHQMVPIKIENDSLTSRWKTLSTLLRLRTRA